MSLVTLHYKKIIFLILIAVGLFFAQSVGAAAISSTNKTSQFRDTNYGTINWLPAGGTAVNITEGAITGDVWSTHFGWIHLDPTGDPLTLTCSGSTGTFSGSAWGEAMGFIDFEPAGGGVTLDSSGQFSGSAWNPNFGWITFSCPGANTCVSTSYTCSGTTTSTTGSTSGSGSRPATCSLEAIPKTIYPGGSVTLQWDTNISEGSLTSGKISGGVGTISSEEGITIVAPKKTTTYKGKFKGDGLTGAATCSTTVTVDKEASPEVIDSYIDTYTRPLQTLVDPENREPIPSDDTLLRGCLDPNAQNYDPEVTAHRQSLCAYLEGVVFGCMDESATNYNSRATKDNDSCQFPSDDKDTQPHKGRKVVVIILVGLGSLWVFYKLFKALLR